MKEAVRIMAPAKVNLRLVVLSRQTTGYHNLETLFCGVSLADLVEISPASPGIELESLGNGIETGPPEKNLVVSAARAYFEEAGIEPAVRIRLEKRIPSAAGLGGGSSDAAATLRALNFFLGDPLDRSRLLGIAADLGSDVPFFLTPTPYALGWGRGERLLALRPPPTRPVVIAHSGVDIPTSWAFGRLAELRDEGIAPSPAAAAFSVSDLDSWDELGRVADNDFDVVARERVPRLQEILSILRNSGASIALLAGSGGSAFGVFPSNAVALRARDALVNAGIAACSARTIRRWPKVERAEQTA